MRSRRLISAATALVLASFVVVACQHHDHAPAIEWRGADLPVPAGSRAMPRAATWCAGRWVVVGATADAQGRTRATVWTSADARTWRTLTLHPRGDFYAARAILTSAGCGRGRLAVLGVKAGGFHGGLRTRSWTQLADGSLAAVDASFALFGGAQAVAATRVQGGSGGYLVAGARVSGAAVWTSRTGAAYRLHEGERGLADTRTTRTLAVDATGDGDHWIVVGTTVDKTGRLTATAWTPAGARSWSREFLPGASTVSTADRVIAASSGAETLVAGLLDRRFGLWVGARGAWLLEGTFGHRDTDGTSAPYVSGLAVAHGRVLATYSDGARFGLAVVSDGESDDQPLPAPVTVNGEHTVTIATHGSDALLLTDDGTTGRPWLAHLP